MGNTYGKNSLNSEDMEFLQEHTELTGNDLAMYENFLSNHPDGTISRDDFRFDIRFEFKINFVRNYLSFSYLLFKNKLCQALNKFQTNDTCMLSRH